MFAKYAPKKKARFSSLGLVEARQHFLQKRPQNLEFLLSSRYLWMSKYTAKKSMIIELGCGTGLSNLWITEPNLEVTDVYENEWVDRVVDAQYLPYENNSIDIFICSHMLHHIPRPVVALEEMERCLKPHGFILVNEVNCSLLMKALLRVVGHEGWDYSIDPFDKTRNLNDPADPWSGNNAIASIMFQERTFTRHFPSLKITKNRAVECLLTIVAGGVTTKTPTMELPKLILSVIVLFDRLVCKLLPNIFGLSRRIAIQKIKSA